MRHDIQMNKQMPSQLRKCQTCGKEFRAYTSELRKGGGKFCSRKCWFGRTVWTHDHFFKHVTKLENGCWVWNGPFTHWGYGKIGTGRGTSNGSRMAHRTSWEFHNGPVPHGMLVCHKCDNPPCIRIDHLFLG